MQVDVPVYPEKGNTVINQVLRKVKIKSGAVELKTLLSGRQHLGV